METTIENIVASCTIAKEFDLSPLAEKLGVTDFDPAAFPGLIFNLDEPKVGFLILRSGKVVTTGCKNLKELRAAMGALVQKLTAAGAPLTGNIEIHIQDIVSVTDVGKELRLSKLVGSLDIERIEYVPEEFPGLIYRMEEPKATILLFKSGKIVCTGTTKMDENKRAIEKITEEIRKTGILA